MILVLESSEKQM